MRFFACFKGIAGPLLFVLLALQSDMLVGSAKAEFITHISVSVEKLGSDYKYEYTLENDAASNFLVDTLSIGINENSQIKNIVGPNGWDVIYNDKDTSVVWTSTDASFNVLPGTIATFSFHSNYGPVQNTYFISGNDGFTETEFNEGNITSPGAVAVPEPISMIPLGIGMASIGAYGVMRKKTAE